MSLIGVSSPIARVVVHPCSSRYRHRIPTPQRRRHTTRSCGEPIRGALFRGVQCSAEKGLQTFGAARGMLSQVAGGVGVGANSGEILRRAQGLSLLGGEETVQDCSAGWLREVWWRNAGLVNWPVRCLVRLGGGVHNGAFPARSARDLAGPRWAMKQPGLLAEAWNLDRKDGGFAPKF